MANAEASVDNLSDETSDDLDAEMDSDQEEDLDKMLGTWLGELENMTKQLGGSDDDPTIPLPVPVTPPPPTPTMGNLDNFRFSMANLEETHDVDLDALLGDLCQMEKELEWQADHQNQNADLAIGRGQDETDGDISVFAQNGNDDVPLDVFQSEIDNANQRTNVTVVSPAQSISTVPVQEPSPPTDLPIPSPISPVSAPTPTRTPTRTPTGTPTSQKERWPTPPPPVIMSMSQTTPTVQTPPPIGVSPTAPSPTTKSTLSPELKSPTNTLEKMSRSVRVRLESLQDNLNKEELTEDEKAARVKAEKIRIALEKLKEARIRKLIIRVYTECGSSKTVLIDENMTSRDVCHLLVDKNHYEETPNWVLVERLPDLYMERIPEDHEHMVTDVLLLWPRETNNTLLFMEKREKYALFKNPQHYLLSAKSSNTAQEFAEKTKQDLIDEFFLSGANSVVELEGALFLKAEGKKSWKKHFCMLRGSGIYYCPKGKSKSLKDLVCYVQFEHVNVYNGIGWKKKYKAPTDFCFALKHPQIMQKSKYIKYMCAEDYRTAQRWITGIRIAKYGKQLHTNYEQTLKEMSDYTSNLGSMRSSDTSSMASVQSSASSQGSQSSQGSSHTSTQSSPGSQSPASSNTSPTPPSLPPKTSLRFQTTHKRSPIPECMSSSVYNNTNNARQEATGTGSVSSRSNTISHPHKSVGDVFASAWKKGSELQQQQHKDDRMSVSSVATVDSELSEPKSQSSRSSSMSISSGSTNAPIWQRDVPQGRQTFAGTPLQGILKPTPQPQKAEPPKQHADMDIQSQLLQLELDLETQSSKDTVSHLQPGAVRLPGFPGMSPTKMGVDEIDSNANQVPVTTVKVMARDREAVSVTVKPPTGLTKHESLKKEKPPPPPKRSGETMPRSASVGNYKRVQFKDDPEIDMPPPPARIPTPPPTDTDLPPPPFPTNSPQQRVTTPTTPSFPSPPPPLTPGSAGIVSPSTPDYPAPPPLSASMDGADITPMMRPKSSSAGERIGPLTVNPGFLADLSKAVKSQPHSPTALQQHHHQQQQQQSGKKPPPPPKRSGGSISKGKKLPPPPPQRFT